MELYFLRHGQTNYNVKDLCNSNPFVDVHLTSLGKKQARDTAEKLKEKKFDIIFVSELPRTLETAEIINKFHDVEIKTDKRINDRKSGFEGKKNSDFLKAIRNNILNGKINEGESFLDEKKRVFSFLDDLVKMNYKIVLVVAHEDTLKIAKGYFENLSDEEIWGLDFGNCEIVDFEV